MPVSPIWAAGAVPLRGTGSNREVMVVHRPAYDDWSLPKGKAHDTELLPATAVREVAEESGVKVRLGPSLTPVRYPVGGNLKLVAWWAGVTLAVKERKPDAEVDEVRWVRPKAALKLLTYADERDVLAQALVLPETTPLIIVRHAKAAGRESWTKKDRHRPLAPQGRQQLVYLGQILRAFGVTRLYSSTSTRCVQTLEPYAAATRSKITTSRILAPEHATRRTVSRFMADVAKKTGSSGRPAVVCGHAPVLAHMLAALDIPYHTLATASCVIAHLDNTGTVVDTEWHDSLRTKV